MLHGILVGASEWALFTRIDASIAEVFREAGCGRCGGRPAAGGGFTLRIMRASPVASASAEVRASRGSASAAVRRAAGGGRRRPRCAISARGFRPPDAFWWFRRFPAVAAPRRRASCACGSASPSGRFGGGGGGGARRSRGRRNGSRGGAGWRGLRRATRFRLRCWRCSALRGTAAGCCERSGGCCRGPFRSGWRRQVGVARHEDGSVS